MSKKPRVDQDLLHRRAQVAVLAGLLGGDDIDALVEAVAPSHVRGWFTPDVAVLELAVTALDLASIFGVPPLEYEGLRERYLPEPSSVVAPSTDPASTRCTPPPASEAVCNRTCSATPAGGTPRCGSTPSTRS